MEKDRVEDWEGQTLARQQIFYRTAVPVSADAHRDVYVRSGKNFDYARSTNSVPLTATEFAPAAGDFPIVFAGNETAVFPAAILGTRDDENLFIDETGQWRSRHVPGFVRRYPFVFSVDEDQSRFTLMIDEEFEGLNREGRGERLFDADGNQTQYLQGVLRFLQDYQAQFVRTQAFCKRLKELEILTPVQAQFSLEAGERRSLGGFMVVDREKLKTLSPETVFDLLTRDELECIYLHLSSLRHFRDMLEKVQKPTGTLAEPLRDAPPRRGARGRDSRRRTRRLRP